MEEVLASGDVFQVRVQPPFVVPLTSRQKPALSICHNPASVENERVVYPEVVKARKAHEAIVSFDIWVQDLDILVGALERVIVRAKECVFKAQFLAILSVCHWEE